ncbi:hypothetical protein CRD15_00175 [Corynebacterium sp. LK28]|nr:FUSC family protein [Corynebacterium sp. LK28]MBC6794140.1 hypothetical protein [Corynebacterium sp. LK28]
MLLVAGGAFAVIYGGNLPYRTRLKVMVFSAALLAICPTIAAWLGKMMWAHMDSGGSHWWLLIAGAYCTFLSGVFTYAQNALRLPPPGGFFIVMVSGGATMIARNGLNPLAIGGWALFGAFVAVIVGMFPALLNPRGPEQQAIRTLNNAVADFEADPSPGHYYLARTSLFEAWSALMGAGIVSGGKVVREAQRNLVAQVQQARKRLMALSAEAGYVDTDEDFSDSNGMVEPTRTAIPHHQPSVKYRIGRSLNIHSHAELSMEKVVLASLTSCTLTIWLGLDRPDWGVITALLILQWGPEKIPGTIRGVHRLLGSVLGIGMFAIAHAFQIGGLPLLFLLAICQFAAEFFIVKNYAFTVIFTTPMALMMGNSLARPLSDVTIDRLAEVFVAMICSFIFLWFWRTTSDTHYHRRLVGHCKAAMGSLLGALLTTHPDDALYARRDLQFELLSERKHMMKMINNNSSYARRVWAKHNQLQLTGYTLLDYCNAHADEELSLSEINRLAASVRALGGT